jgi:hypothetical protein
MACVQVKPVISTTALECRTTAGSATVTSSAAFGSVAVGMRVVGPGIPFNSVVGAVASTSSVSIVNARSGDVAMATATSVSVNLQFGYFSAAIYADGDALGFPFEVPLTEVHNVVLVDSSAQLTKAKLAIFSKAFTESADNAAWEASAADAANIIGYFAVATAVSTTNAKIVTQATTALPAILGANSPVWGQLIVDTNTPTFSAIDNITLILTGE